MPKTRSTHFDHRSVEVFDVLDHLVFERHPTFRAELRLMFEASLPCPGGPDLSTAEGRRNLTRLVWHPHDIASGSPLRSSVTMATAVKVALAVDDARAGRWHLVPSGAFVTLLEDLGLPVAVDRPGSLPACPTPTVGAVPPASAGDVLQVEFIFPWRPSPVGTRQRLGTSTGVAGVTVIDPSDAPVACSLLTPEGRLHVRRYGETWLRPLLSPGSWAPIAFDHFREAAATGVAWRNSPFLPHSGRNNPTFHLCDYASPRSLAKGDRGRIDRARDVCLARAGWLCVVDGIVHRVTEEPLAGVAARLIDGRVEVVPAWSLGDLDSTRSMGTLECHEGLAARWVSCKVGSASAGGPPWRDTFLPLADWAAVVASSPKDGFRRDVGHGGPWPPVRDLVRLGPGHVWTCDGRVALRVAAKLASDALSPSRSYWAVMGGHCGLGKLERMLVALDRDVGSPEQRRYMLSQVVSLCQGVPEAFRGASVVEHHVWTHVAVLATHAVGLLADARTDEDLAFVRL